MPVYEYRCPACGNEQEVVSLKISDKKEKCDRCNTTMQRKMSVSTTHFKGSGWTPKYHK